MNKQATLIFNNLIVAQKKLKNADPYGANYRALISTINSNESMLKNILQGSNISNWEVLYKSLIAQTKPNDPIAHKVLTRGQEVSIALQKRKDQERERGNARANNELQQSRQDSEDWDMGCRY